MLLKKNISNKLILEMKMIMNNNLILIFKIEKSLMNQHIQKKNLYYQILIPKINMQYYKMIILILIKNPCKNKIKMYPIRIKLY